MSEIVLFHHALGRAPGLLALAHAMRRAGHQVHVPDLHEGVICQTLDEGVHHARTIGFDVLLNRAQVFVKPLSPSLVYAGVSLGVLPAQMLTQTRSGAKGALLLEACVPISEFSSDWPDAVPVEIHGMEQDPVFVGEGDLQNAQDLKAAVPAAALFLYPGNQHLFTDQMLPSYNHAAAGLLLNRVASFLDGLNN